jgi:tRNA modification GTPase
VSLLESDSFASVLTPTGRGAVATIRVRADAKVLCSVINQFFQPANSRPLEEQEIGRVCFGLWCASEAHGTNTEEVVVCRVSETHVEVNCHGGKAAIDRIMQMLADAGFNDRTGGQMPGYSSLAAECQHALTLATTRRTVEFILRQLPDRLETAVVRFIELLDGGPAKHDGSGRFHEQNSQAIDDCQSQLAEILKHSEFGLHLTQPWRVVLVGRPNVGKSTLINALLGYDRAIVFDQPGTTRDVVVGQTAFDGWPIQLADTAGIRATDNALESAGIARSQEEIANADCVCILLDLSNQLSADDLDLLKSTSDQIDQQRIVVVLHKSDLEHRWSQSDLPSLYQDRTVHVSSTSQTGVDSLINEVVSTLVPTVPADDVIVPLTVRQIKCLSTALEFLCSEEANPNLASKSLRQLVDEVSETQLS